jgi:hypothetical protein
MPKGHVFLRYATVDKLVTRCEIFACVVFKWYLYLIFVKVLGTEQFGQCSDYQAVPGFGLQCKISGVENLLKEKRKLTDSDVIPTSSDG